MVDMPSTRLIATLAAAMSAAALAPAAAQAAPAVLSVEQRPFTVSTEGATIAWSSYDPATARYRLMTLVAGRPAALPVAGAAAPFDVDLGRGADGRVQAVYSRCAVPGEPGADPGRGSDCDLYRYDFAAARETRLDRLNTSADEREPSIDGARVAFVRTERARRHGGRQDVVRLGSLAVRRPSRRMFAAGSALHALVDDVQLQGDRLAFVAGRSYGECCFIQKLFLRRLSGARSGGLRSIYRAVSGGANAANIVSPTFDRYGTELFWARTNNGSGTGNRLYRRTLPTGLLASEQGNPSIASMSWAGGPLGAVLAMGDDDAGCGNDTGASTCRLVATGPLAFRGRG